MPPSVVADTLQPTMDRIGKRQRRHIVPPAVPRHRDVSETERKQIGRDVPAYNHAGTVIVGCAWLAFYIIAAIRHFVASGH